MLTETEIRTKKYPHTSLSDEEYEAILRGEEWPEDSPCLDRPWWEQR